MKNYTDTSYHGPVKPFIFLALVIFWLSLIYFLFLILFGSAEDHYNTLNFTVNSSKNILSSVNRLFEHADDWNWLTLTIVLSLTVIIFNLNDIYIRPFVNKWLKNGSDKAFSYKGLCWSIRILLNVFVSGCQIVMLAYIINISVGSQRIFGLNEISGKHYVVLLGTSKYLKGTKEVNVYYQQRIDAVLDLYKHNLIKGIIISGDHQGEHYSEPIDMMGDLVKQGVPKTIITLDLSGYRTFDSILKLKQTQGQTYIFVSQHFHLERALYIASNNGIDAFGYAATGTMTMNMVKREIFAKTKVLLDIYILNTQAFGIPAYPRRHLSLFKGTDIILLSFVLCVVFLAGRLSRPLLTF